MRRSKGRIDPLWPVGVLLCGASLGLAAEDQLWPAIAVLALGTALIAADIYEAYRWGKFRGR